MSRTHKPKPPDKGESAPKPSRKLAMEEVLRSLQDLVNNELSLDEPKPETPPAAVAPRTAPAPEPEIPIALTPASAPDDARADAGIDLEALPQGIPETATAPETVPTIKQPGPPGGLQQDLPFLEPEPAIKAEVATTDESSPLLVEPDFPSPELPGTDELDDHPGPTGTGAAGEPGNEPGGLPDAPFPASTAEHAPELVAAAPADLTETTDAGASPSVADTADLNDIPVLEDAVELAEEAELHADQDEPLSSATTLLAARDGRRVAIQVAARLNVELRKAGQPGLSSDIIARLAHLLEETLAKGAANMENSRKTKH